MGDKLWSLREACGHLSDTRITVRKKGEGVLRDLLNNDTIISLLDSAGANSSQPEFSWKQVYSSVLTFLKHEVDKIKTDENKDKQAKNAESIRGNRKREVMALYSLVIRKAEKGLKWAKIVENILEMLENEFFKKMFADDFVRILTNIVSHPKKLISIGVAGMEEGHQWNTILETTMDLICEAPENLDTLNAIQLLHATIQHGLTVCDMTQSLYTPRFLQLLNTLLTANSNAFRSGSPAKLEAIKLATLFCEHACYDLRYEVCKLGEESLHCVIPSWEDKRPSTQPVIDFIKIQLIVHHPGGCRDEKEGALVCDKQTWTHQLHRVQQNIIFTTISNKMRQNRSRGTVLSADYELGADLLDLAVRVFCQTLTAEQEDLINITQMVQLDTTQVENMNGSAPKRLRLDKSTTDDRAQLDVSFTGFLAKIQTPVENDLTKIPWLQILSGLLQQSPTILKNSELQQHILFVLSNFLQTTKATATKRHCLSACLSLVHCNSELISGSSLSTFLGLPDWDTVMRVTLNLVSMNQADYIAHNLLQAFLRGPKGKPLKDQIFALYQNHLIRHSNETLDTLVHLVNSTSMNMEIRTGIVNWLWQDLEDGREDARLVKWEDSPQIFANILLGLVTEKIEENGKNSKTLTRSKKSCLTPLENDLLVIDHVLPLIQGKPSIESQPESKLRRSLISKLCDEVESNLSKDCCSFISSADLDPQAVKTALGKCLALLYYLAEVMSNKATPSRVLDKIQKLHYIVILMFKKSADLSVKMMKKQKNNSNTAVMESLLNCWAWFWLELKKVEGAELELTWILNDGALWLQSLLTQLKEVVEIIQEKKLRVSEASSQDSGDSGFNPFDEFNSGAAAVSQDDTNGVTDKTMGADLHVENSAEEEQEFQLLESAFNALIPFEKLDLSTMTSGYEERRISLVESLVLTHNLWELSPRCIHLVTSCVVQVLNASAVSSQVLEKICVILRQFAKNSMTAKSFDPVGMASVLTILQNMIPHVCRLNSESCGLTVERLLPVIVKLNAKNKYSRLGAEFTVHLVNTIASFGEQRDDMACLKWAPGIHNITSIQNSSCGIDSDENILLVKSLPRFLVHPSQKVRLTAARCLFKSASFNVAKFHQEIEPCVIEDLSQVTFYSKLSEPEKISRLKTAIYVCLALTACDISFTRHALSTVFCANSKQQQAVCLQAAIKLIAFTTGFQSEALVLKSCLAGVFQDFLLKGYYLQDFSFEVFGYSSKDISKFVCENSLLLVLLLDSPDQTRLQDLAHVCKESVDGFVKTNTKILLPIVIIGQAIQGLHKSCPKSAKLVQLGRLLQSFEWEEPSAEGLTETIFYAYSSIDRKLDLKKEFDVDEDYTHVLSKPHDFNPKAIQEVEDYLGTIFKKNVYEYLCIKRPSALPELALRLCLELDSPFKADKLQCLSTLNTWLNSLFKANPKSISACLPFITVYICQRILNFIQAEADLSCKVVATETLCKFVRHLMEVSPTSIALYAVELNTCLIAIIMDNPDSKVSLQAKSLLEYLFVENTTKFSTILSRLEDFPDTNDFSILIGATRKFTESQTMEHVITNFLIIADTVPEEFLENSLSCLKSNLEIKVQELAGLVDSTSELIYSLVKKLFSLVKARKVSILTLTLDCLGILGPIQLIPIDSSDAPIMSDISRPATYYIRIVVNELFRLLKISQGTMSVELFTTLRKIFSITSEGKHLNFNEFEKNASLLKSLQDSCSQKNKSANCIISDTQALERVYDSPIWNSESISYEKWIKSLMKILMEGVADFTLLACMADLCQTSLHLCELIFPFIIHEYLLANVETGLVISTKVNDVIKSLVNSGDQMMETDQNSDAISKPKKKLIVDLITYLRSMEKPQELVIDTKLQSWENNFWIGDLDYLQAAQLALDCKEYMAAMLFADIWITQQDYHIVHSDRNHFKPLLADMLQSCPDATTTLQEILTTSSLKIEDDDTNKGLSLLLSKSSEVKSLTLVDIMAEKSSLARDKLVTTMYESGMIHTLSQYIGSLQSDEKNQLSDLQSECSWILGKWDDTGSNAEDTPSFNRCLLGGLHSLKKHDCSQLESWVKLAQNTLVNGSSNGIMTSALDCNILLGKLKQTSELAMFKRCESDDTFEKLMKGCIDKDKLLYKGSCNLEQVYNLRKSLVDCSSNLSCAQSQKEYIELCKGGREAGYFPFCYRIIEQLKDKNLPALQVETAKIQWQQGMQKEAIQTAFFVKESAAKNTDFYANLLVTLGNWMNIERTESSKVIHSDYYTSAVEILEKGEEGKMDETGLIQAYISLAQLADQHFRKADEYIQSSEFKERQENLEIRQKELVILKVHKAVEKEKSKRESYVIKERFIRIDNKEIERCYDDRKTHLAIAIENYMKVLHHGNNSLAVYRFLSLWLGNSDNEEINAQISTELASIPTYRLIPLLYQMAARMSDTKGKNGTSFAVLIFNLIKRCCIEHPHHALPIVFALKNANMDEIIDKKMKPDSVFVDERGKAAIRMIKEVAAITELRELIENYDMLTSSMIEVAYVACSKDTKGSIQLSSKLQYVKIKGLNCIPVLTDSLPVRPDCNYTNYPGIYKFEPSFKLVGGINAPKRTECIGTDGVRRAQLIKGQDDLRQDAVMQQVFELTNQLFIESKETQEQRLKMRTYKIVPLSQRSGIMQWCSNTMPFGNILIGESKNHKKDGLHYRYYPKAPSYLEMHTTYTKNSKDPENMFALLCKQLPPAFKFFFLENFRSPMEHHMARKRYTKSVAVSSMVGYILGIGDRHLSNILVDLKTAEFVHIDFGIAFDKGKILPTPELIPFRLTRDVIDGFGPLGIEGGFRLNCERSMGVLRENKEKLLTVLEVMLHDPLYDWSVGPSKVAARQAGEWEQLKQHEAGQGNRMALRVLMMLKEKLDGRKDGSSFSVSGQVGDLIQEAINPAHLSRIFVGWASWC